MITGNLTLTMKEMFREVLQQVMESEVDAELGYEKSQHMSETAVENKLRNYRNADGMEEKILGLYACGMSQRDILEQIKSLYDVDISPEL